MPTQSDEIKRLREQAGLTQEEAAERLNMKTRTFGGYERGEREIKWKTMKKVRRVLGGKKRGAPQDDHVRHITLRHAGAGPGHSAQAEDEIVLDERLFASSDIDFNDHEFIRVQGSSMEPVLSHGQIVFVEPVGEVRGQDVYVYWRGDEQGYVVAIVESTTSGLLIEKKSPRPSSVEWAHQKNHIYESENGETVELRIFGRVLGSFGSPAQQIAAQNQAARHGAMAAQV